jgi:hypothetical protein
MNSEKVIYAIQLAEVVNRHLSEYNEHQKCNHDIFSIVKEAIVEVDAEMTGVVKQ